MTKRYMSAMEVAVQLQIANSGKRSGGGKKAVGKCEEIYGDGARGTKGEKTYWKAGYEYIGVWGEAADKKAAFALG